MTIVERARLLMAKCPPAISGQGGHASTFRVASALVWGFGLTPEEAYPLMQEFNTSCLPPWPERDLWHKLRSALSTAQSKPRGHLLSADTERGNLPDYVVPKRKQAVQFDPQALRRAQAPGLEINPAWLRYRSPYDPRVLAPGQMIDLLYRPEDKVMLFIGMKSRGDYMRWRGQWWRLAKEQGFKAAKAESIPDRSKEGMIWLIQPVDGLWHPKYLAKGSDSPPEMSRRTKQSLTRFPMMLLESDEAAPGLWLNVMVRLRIPIVMMVQSGGRSIHALVRIDAEDEEEWLTCVGVVRDRMAAIGCDSQALSNPCVNVRCPNTWREGKTREGQFMPFTTGPALQRCLYFNPEAGMKSIHEQPIYNHEATIK
jgi:hypothetical protein